MLNAMWPTEHTFALCWLLCDQQNILSRYADCCLTNRTYFRGMLIVMWPTEHTFEVCWLLCDQQNILSRYADCYVTNRTYFRGMPIVMWPTEHNFAVCWLLCDQQNILLRYATHTDKQSQFSQTPSAPHYHGSRLSLQLHNQIASYSRSNTNLIKRSARTHSVQWLHTGCTECCVKVIMLTFQGSDFIYNQDANWTKASMTK